MAMNVATWMIKKRVYYEIIVNIICFMTPIVRD